MPNVPVSLIVLIGVFVVAILIKVPLEYAIAVSVASLIVFSVFGGGGSSGKK